MIIDTLLFIPLSLSTAHLLGVRYRLKSKKNAEMVTSLAAGFSIGYVFLILLPEVFKLSDTAEFETMIAALAGFVLFHASLKMIFRQKDQTEKANLLDELHLVTLSIYNFLIAFFVVEQTRLDFSRGIVIFVIITAHIMLTELTHKEMDKTKIDNLKLPAAVISSFVGGVLAIAEVTSQSVTALLFSLTAGAIIYISIREELPKESSGSPALFILGAFIVTIIIQLFEI